MAVFSKDKSILLNFNGSFDSLGLLARTSSELIGLYTAADFPRYTKAKVGHKCITH